MYPLNIRTLLGQQGRSQGDMADLLGKMVQRGTSNQLSKYFNATMDGPVLKNLKPPIPDYVSCRRFSMPAMILTVGMGMEIKAGD